MPIYTYTHLKNRVNAKIKGKIGMLTDARETINEGVREVLGDFDIVSARRKALLTPNLFKDIFEYASPADIKAYSIINIEPQTDRARAAYSLIPSEEFYRRREANKIAISDNDFIKKILVNSNQLQDKSIMVSTLDALNSGGGTWEAVGDAQNVAADSDNYVRENASLSFDIGSGGGLTAGLKNTAINQFDITEFLGGNSSLFVWVWLTSPTNISDFTLKIGSSETAYYLKSTVSASDGTAFRAGWNLLRFDLTSMTPTGSPVITAIDFISIYMTKTAGKINETDYRFDWITIKKGEMNYVIYYSKFGWQNSSGTYLENSTADSDFLNVDTDEYNMLIAKCSELAAPEVDEDDVEKKQGIRYNQLMKGYKMTHPSEALTMISTVADFKNT